VLTIVRLTQVLCPMTMRFLHALTLFFFVLIASACQQAEEPGIGYSPSANPATDLANARTVAASSGRKVLIIAGGDWCRWCHVLYRFLKQNPDVEAEMDKAFVVVKVYYGDDNTNEAFFSTLPEADGFPHFWVLSSNGTILKSISTGGLESGSDDYDRERFRQFIRDANGA